MKAFVIRGPKGRQVQNAGHRSQVTENSIKKFHSIRLLSLLMFIVICFISGYATTSHMFAIVHALGFGTEGKTAKLRKLHIIVLEIEEFLLWRSRNEAISSLHANRLKRGSERRMERKNSHVCAESNMAQDESFEVRKQYLLTRYFGLSSTEELKNDTRLPR